MLNKYILSLSDINDDSKIHIEEHNNEDKIRFITEGQQRMIISNSTTSGNIGIGLNFNNPTSTLDIQGELAVSNKIGIGTSTVETSLDVDSSLKVFDVLNNVSGYVNTSSGDYMKLQATSRTDTNTKKNILLNPDGGNVGIGTTNPGSTLDIFGQNISLASPAASQNTTSLYLKDNFPNEVVLTAQGTIARKYNVGGVWYGSGLHFTDNTFLPVGNNYITAVDKIVSLGNADYRFNYNYCQFVNVSNSITINNPNNTAWFWNINCSSGANNIHIQPSSGVGLYGSPGFSTLNSMSDDRVKHNEVNITNGLDIIMQLKPQVYNKTAEFLDADFNGNLDDLGLTYHKNSGFIAQEIYSITELQHLVNVGNEQDPWFFDYIQIIPYNTAAIKELKIKNDTLETKNTELETEVSTLKTQLADLLARVSALESN